MDIDAAHALIRFGLGPKGDTAAPANPRQWLRDQLAVEDPGPAIPSTADGLAALHYDRENKTEGADRRVPPLVRDSFRATILHAIDTDTPFRERLVWFWANHFAVSTRQGGCAPVVCAFMQEAIRPYVTGPFVAMLQAVMRHPAMLMYLDNTGSVGPDSPAGQRGHRGLNENLARECLELHTVTPAVGYTQADVTSFAQLITGWSVELKAEPPGFLFRPNAHQPGEQTVMGHSFPEGEEGGIAALNFLGTHPATYRSIATKLARHFIADDPPASAVARLTAVLARSGGDLGQASAALVGIPECWANPLGKLRTPQEFVIAAFRAGALSPDKRPDPLGIMGALGQPVFNAPLPNGWPDRAADWSAPEEMLRRVDWAYGYAGRLSEADADVMADATLGPLARADTLEAIRRAGSRRDAVTLLFTSPEFQRR